MEVLRLMDTPEKWEKAYGFNEPPSSWFRGNFLEPRLRVKDLMDITPTEREMKFAEAVRHLALFYPEKTYLSETKNMMHRLKKDFGREIALGYRQHMRKKSRTLGAAAMDPPAFIGPATTVMNKEGSNYLNYNVLAGSLGYSTDAATELATAVTRGGLLVSKKAYTFSTANYR